MSKKHNRDADRPRYIVRAQAPLQAIEEIIATRQLEPAEVCAREYSKLYPKKDVWVFSLRSGETVYRVEAAAAGGGR